MLFPTGAQWFNFRNDSGETIPPFGVVRIQDAGIVDGNRLVLSAAKPNDYGSQYLHYINGGSEVAANAFGSCALATGPVWARYGGGDTPTPGEYWGPVADSFSLSRFVGGFQAVGAQEEGRVLVVQSPLLLAFGKLVLACNKGTFGVVDMWHGAVGFETASGILVSNVFNRVQNMAAGSPVHVKFSPYGKELSPAEC